MIGSRWPIRDDEAAWFFGAFYRHLGTGVSLAAALRLAKRDAIAAGRPARAWAGVVLLGSGDLRPQPLHPPATSAPRPTLLVLVIVAVAMLSGPRLAASGGRSVRGIVATKCRGRL